jgi:hypothetical protein
VAGIVFRSSRLGVCLAFRGEILLFGPTRRFAHPPKHHC